MHAAAALVPSRTYVRMHIRCRLSKMFHLAHADPSKMFVGEVLLLRSSIASTQMMLSTFFPLTKFNRDRSTIDMTKQKNYSYDKELQMHDEMALQTLDKDLQEEAAMESQRVDEVVLRSSDKDLQEEAAMQPQHVKLALHDEHVGISDSTPPFRFVPLRMGGNGGTHKPSSGSASLD